MLKAYINLNKLTKKKTATKMNMEYDKTVVGHGMFGMLPQNPMFKQQKRPPTTIALDDLTQLSKNHKRVGSHAILTDYLLGKGHYGSVYPHISWMGDSLLVYI